MLCQFIENISNFMEEQKVSIRRVTFQYVEKMNSGKISERTRNFHILANVILPNHIKTSSTMVEKIAYEWMQQVEEKIQNKVNMMFIANAESYLEHLIDGSNDIRKKSKSDQDLIKAKEKQAIVRLTELNQRLFGQRRPTFLSRLVFFWRWKRKEDNSANVIRELMQLNGTVTFLRIRLKAHSTVLKMLNEYREYLVGHLLQKVKFVKSKLTQALVSIESELSKTDQMISDVKGYQIDLHTRNKIEGMISSRMNEHTVESISRQVLPELESRDAQGIVSSIKNKLLPLFEDLQDFGAIQRLCELYPKGDNVGTFFQTLEEKEGSPYCPLNNRLLDKTPRAITTYGIADIDMKNRIENVVDGRVTRGSYGVSLQPEIDRITCLTSIHRIPVFALSQFSEYMTAVDMKQRYSRYAVYPERRWQEYDAVEPSTQEMQVTNLLALGFASGLIAYCEQGWYKVNGYKIRGIAELRSRLSADAVSLDRIKNWWLDVYSRSGINGVLQVLSEGEMMTENINGMSKTVQTIRNRIEKVNGETLSRERFINVLTSVE